MRAPFRCLDAVLEGLGFACDTRRVRRAGHGAGAQPLCAARARRPQFLLRRPYRRGAAGRPRGWSVDPFAGTVSDGTLYGRGAVDMKGAHRLLCRRRAPQFLAARGPDFGGSISLLITGDEEGGGDQRHAQAARLAGRARRAARCLHRRRADQRRGRRRHGQDRPARQPQRLPHGARHAGPHRLSASRRQRGAPAGRHAARADRRRRSIAAARISRPRPCGSRRSTSAIRRPTSFPATARAVFNIRFNDGWSSDDARALAAATRSMRSAGATISRSRSAANPSWCRRARSATFSPSPIERVTGLRPELSTTGGTSDARFIHRFCPVAEFGLVGLTMHKVDERVAARRPRRA